MLAAEVLSAFSCRDTAQVPGTTTACSDMPPTNAPAFTLHVSVEELQSC